MRQILLTLLLFTSLIFVQACKSKQSVSNIQEQITVDSNYLSENGKSALQLFTKKFSDSLNDWKEGEPFPVFLADQYFDYNNIGLWSPPHSPISLRNLIFKDVSNCNLISKILNSKEAYLKIKPGIKNGIDAEMSSLSFFDFAKQRHVALKCK
jgi:hypothetical protein